MKCDLVTELADQYIDDDLAEELRAQIARHLLKCAACSHQIHSLEQTDQSEDRQ